MAYVIFDLDGTVIDSSHRHATLPDGSIDLAHWRENATPEKIAKDGLLPLVRSMRALHDAGHHIIICTARFMTLADLHFLGNNDIPYHGLLSRAIDDVRPDADMKAELLTTYFANRDLRLGVDVEPIMFDDNLKVVARMIKMGVQCLDAGKINKRMNPL
jgi:hypothetical protein